MNISKRGFHIESLQIPQYQFLYSITIPVLYIFTTYIRSITPITPTQIFNRTRTHGVRSRGQGAAAPKFWRKVFQLSPPRFWRVLQ